MARAVAIQVASGLAAAMDAMRVDLPPAWMQSDLPLLIAELVSLPPNWDGYEARPIGAAAINNTYALLQTTMPASAPTIEANPTGSVIVEWETGDNFLSVELDESGALVEYEIDDQDGEFELFGRAEQERLESLLKQLAGT